MRMAIDGVGLNGPFSPKTTGTCAIFQKNPHLYIYFLTTSLKVATKLTFQILPGSWILRVAVEYRGPYTLPISNHSFFRINGIRKCDRNIKYTAAVLASNFDIRVVCDGPSHASSSCVYVRLIKISVLNIYNNFLLGEQFSLR